MSETAYAVDHSGEVETFEKFQTMSFHSTFDEKATCPFNFQEFYEICKPRIGLVILMGPKDKTLLFHGIRWTAERKILATHLQDKTSWPP